jgi:hypothetical protein
VQTLPQLLPPVEMGTTQQEFSVTRNNIQWNVVNHDRGTGCWKVVFPNGKTTPIKPAALRGAWAWLQRGDKRQVTMDLVNGTLWCEQQ